MVVRIERVVVAGSNEFGPFYCRGVFLGADFIWIDGGAPGGVFLGEFHKKAVSRRFWWEDGWYYTFGPASAAASIRNHVGRVKKGMFLL